MGHSLREAILIEPAPVDFKQIIADIEGAGITTYKIALMCRRSFNTVKHWKQTGRIEHYDGEKLLVIHSEYCKVCSIASAED